ncbi:50S ribosomal protein L21 [bacterium]|nr:50S ribosomal protein L21 [bacterium]
MYAVVKIGGMQWKVTHSQILRVPKIDQEPGSSVEFDQVMLVVNKDDVQIGQPILSGVNIKATILSHGKAKKIKVFKKKRRKRYNVLKGHRQEYTELRVDRIGAVKEVKKPPVAVKEKAVKDVTTNQKQKKASPPTKTASKTISDKGGKTKGMTSATKSRSRKTSISKETKKKSDRPKTGSQTKVTKSPDKKKKD